MCPSDDRLPAVERPGRLLVVVLAPLFMALVAVSVINVALPAIGGSLDAGSTGLQWVLSGYALAFGLLLVAAGRAGDATGRKRMLLIGVGVFTAGSLLSGLAPTIELLNAARIVQGIGSGLMNPQVIGIIAQYFRGQERARAFAMLGSTIAVATAVGPVIGGLFVTSFGEDLGWRLMFLINVPIGIFALVAGRSWVPSDTRRRGGGRVDLDPVGTVLLGLALLGVMLPFLERGVDAPVWLTAVAGLLLAAVWIRWERRYERRGREPMVHLGIFRDRGFSNGILIVTVFFLGSTSIWIVVPLFLQLHLGQTALAAGLVSLPSSVMAAISSQIGGRYVLRFGRSLVAAGFAVAALGLSLTALTAPVVASGRAGIWLIALPLSLIGLSQGLTISPNQTLTLNAVDPRYGGVAGGILQTGQRIGAAVGTAMIPGVVFQLTEHGSSWLQAFLVALGMITVLTIAAMGIALWDRRRERALASISRHSS